MRAPEKQNEMHEISAYPTEEGIAVFIKDVTERRRLEDELTLNEEKYRGLFNNAEIGMFRTKANGSTMLDFNEKFFGIFGFSRVGMLGASSVGFWADPQERAEMSRLLQAQGSVASFDCRILNKRG